MTPNPEQLSRAFKGRCLMIDLLAPIPAYVLTLGYLGLIFDLEQSEWLRLAGCLAGFAIAAGLYGDGRRRRQAAPIVRFLDRASMDGSNRSLDAEASAAFRSIVSLPLEMQKTKFFAGLSVIVIVPPLMWMLGFDAWFGLARIRSLAMISLVVSLMSGALVFYWAKQGFSELRAALASEAGDSIARSGLVARRSLRQKLLLAIAVPTFASVMLVVDVVQVKMHSSAEAEAVGWALIAVESVAGADASLPIAARVANQLPAEKFWPMPLRTTELQSDRLGGDSGADISASLREALDRELELGATMGSVIPVSGPEIGAFRRLDNGRVLVSKILRIDLAPQLAALNWAIGIVCLWVLAIAVAVGRLASSEVSAALETLAGTATRMADGDFVQGVV